MGNRHELNEPLALPSLAADGSFWGMAATQFFGAFNDNLFKQMILLMSLTVAVSTATPTASSPTASSPSTTSPSDSTSDQAGDALLDRGSPAGSSSERAAAEPAEGRDLQAIAMAVFGLPFLLWSGLAGFLSERISKRTVVVVSKLAECLVMGLGVAAFLAYDLLGTAGLLIVLFLMGTQSAFFGPGKYGILPEMLRKRDLPAANGLFLMTTFLAIIFGTAAAGFLMEHLADRLWLAGLGCVAIAVAGTLTSLPVRAIHAADPDLVFTRSTLWVAEDIWKLLKADRPLTLALLASCVFWLVGGIVMSAVNSVGLIQLEAGEQWTSILTASVGFGIAAGCLLAGAVSRGRANFGVMRLGCWGIVLCLLTLGMTGQTSGHPLGYRGCLLVLIALGGFTGMFAVPLQVFLQLRPPAGMKGRLIATMNQANWVAIVLSAGVYMVFVMLIERFDLPRSSTFLFTALLMLPVAILYRPQSQGTESDESAAELPPTGKL